MEAAYRQTGEHVRQLPTITPPDSFRAAVFAAIRAEDAKVGRTIERVANDDTQPSLPVLRPTPIRTWSPRGAVLGARGAIAVAAVLLLGFSVARFAPAVAAGMPRLTDYLSGALAVGQASGPHIASYQVSPSAARVTSAMASGHWLVYVARDGQGRSVAYARERGTTNTFALPGARSASAVTLLAVTDTWAIWQTGAGQSSGSWAVWASPLTPNGAALSLVNSRSASALTGVWATGNTVLATYATPSEGSLLARFDLAPGHAAPAARIIAQVQAPTHELAAPSLAGNTYYWSEVSSTGGTGLHGAIWRLDSSGVAQAITGADTVFAPHATGHTLIYVQTNGPASAAPTALGQIAGVLRTVDMMTGAQRELVAHVTAGSVQVAGSLVVWRDGSQTRTYDLGQGAPSQVDSVIRSASYVSANGGSLTWGQTDSSTINIYDGR